MNFFPMVLTLLLAGVICAGLTYLTICVIDKQPGMQFIITFLYPFDRELYNAISISHESTNCFEVLGSMFDPEHKDSNNSFAMIAEHLLHPDNTTSGPEIHEPEMKKRLDSLS